MGVLERLKGISVKYGGGITAVREVDLNVKEREALAITGPNGAGKTTLLRVMALLDEPTSGQVFYRDLRVEDANRNYIRRRITMTFQRTVLFNTTVYKNVAYGLKVRGYSKDKIDRKVKEALEMVGMREHMNRAAKNLSGGEQQRVVLARAIALEPELLLLDEPLANVDPPNATILENVLRDLKKETTIVFATHDLFQGVRLADRLAFMREGRILQVGKASDAFRKPVDVFTAKFFGFENVFKGMVIANEEGVAKVAVGDIKIEAVSDKRGSCHVCIRPEDIIVSGSRLESSARNVFRGVVVDSVDMGAFIKLTVDVKGTPFKVLVTKRSFNDMKLTKNASVFLSVKASSINLI